MWRYPRWTAQLDRGSGTHRDGRLGLRTCSPSSGGGRRWPANAEKIGVTRRSRGSVVEVDELPDRYAYSRSVVNSIRARLAGDQLGKAQLVDGDLALAECLDLAGVDILGDDVVAQFRHAGGRDQSYIPGTDPRAVNTPRGLWVRLCPAPVGGMTTTVVCGPAAGPRPHVARCPAIG